MSLLSDLEDARESLPGHTDSDRVRILARHLLADLEASPPVDLDMLASSRDIASIVEAELPCAACLVKQGVTFRIQVRQSDSRRRRRFSIAHEIGHTFLPGYALTTQFRCDPVGQGRRDQIEVLSDIAASELLMPHSFVEDVLLNDGATVDAADAVSATCDASFEASARRIVDIHGDAVLIVFELGCAPRQPHASPKLRVRYSHPQGEWPFIPTHKSIDDDHPVQRCLEGEVVDEMTTLASLSRKPVDVRMSAMYVPWDEEGSGRHHRVFCIASRG